MKREYTRPVFETEIFEANVAVAACYEGVASCDLGKRMGWDANGLQHGRPCGNGSEIYFTATEGGTGVETMTGNRLSNIQVNATGDVAQGQTYTASWENYDGNIATPYLHSGTIRITKVDLDRPNHS